jgi:D-tyrosyl-tRNA(Tyr) deacylase
MRAIVQRVSSARVEVAGQTIGAIGPGLCCFVGAGASDTDADMQYMVRKVVSLRVFRDDTGKMSKSVKEIDGEVLLISQFTVYGDVRRGRRPSFTRAMAPEQARETFARFVERVRAAGVRVATGQFAADMRVVVDNDGPVSVLIDSQKTF